jgi:hypothetical protein
MSLFPRQNDYQSRQDFMDAKRRWATQHKLTQPLFDDWCGGGSALGAKALAEMFWWMRNACG